MDVLERLPGQRGAGTYLALCILVQNRRQIQSQKPKSPSDAQTSATAEDTSPQIIVTGNSILAIGTPRGSSVLLQGMKPGETHLKIDDPNK